MISWGWGFDPAHRLQSPRRRARRWCGRPTSRAAIAAASTGSRPAPAEPASRRTVRPRRGVRRGDRPRLVAGARTRATGTRRRRPCPGCRAASRDPRRGVLGRPATRPEGSGRSRLPGERAPGSPPIPFGLVTPQAIPVRWVGRQPRAAQGAAAPQLARLGCRPQRLGVIDADRESRPVRRPTLPARSPRPRAREG